ncbi:ABC transporter permease [Coleofasciculus sp. H7-2]|uniref:ABC transporter permease n=1 Tax=Coleofasciculus sp. H7-2 TaxID=3351545 RepID=UPI003672E939
MKINWSDRLGDGNPQLLREIKGRLKPRNVLIAVAIALMGQMLLLMSLATQLPVDTGTGDIYSRYCLNNRPGYGQRCLVDSLGNLVINWQLWWLDVFVWLSVIGCLTVLVAGTYMLISDLSREENRGTLNFIRLSPQSTTSIFSGKLLGVPILLYLLAGLAIPLHLLAGLSAEIPLVLILGFYGVVVASAACIYSAALLYGLVAGGLGGFQSWIGSGIVLMFLSIMTSMSLNSSPLIHNSLDWLHLFSPSIVLAYLIDASSQGSAYSTGMVQLEAWKWFYLPLGASVWNVIGFSVLNYAVGTLWFWQGMKRCFHNSGATLLSKRQSYLLTACFEVAVLGFALTLPKWRTENPQSIPNGLFDNFGALLLLNLPLFLCLMAALSPHRQVLQDWARYRREKTSSRVKNLVQDLVWGDKSPSVVAVALNLLIASTIVVPWILLWSASAYKASALATILLSVNLILIYAGVAQLMLFMKTPKRSLWAASTVAGLIILPPVIFSLLSLAPAKMPGIWLFSVFSLAAVKDAAAPSLGLAVLGQWLMFSLLSIQTARQLRQAGESASKSLMSSRSSLPATGV